MIVCLCFKHTMQTQIQLISDSGNISNSENAIVQVKVVFCLIRREVNGAGDFLLRKIDSYNIVSGLKNVNYVRLLAFECQGTQLMIVLQLYQLAICMAAGIVIIRHSALSAFAPFFCTMPIINRSKVPHAIVQVNRYPACYCQVKNG